MTQKLYLRGKHSDKFALIDDNDYLWISEYRWYLNSNGYAISIRNINGKTKTFFMHKEILKPKEGLFTDHINGDKLDNRRENLREVTRSQNSINMSFLGHKDSKTGHVGVYWHKSARMYEAVITHNKKKYHLGHYNDIEDAIDAYLIKRRELYGNLMGEDM
jgi:hypothetical protein